MSPTITPQDTFDHLLGSRTLLSRPWWDVECPQGITGDNIVRDDWHLVLRHVPSDTRTRIDHKTLMRTMHEIASHDDIGVDHVSPPARDQVRSLLATGQAHFDQDMADEVLQVVMFGLVVFR